MKAKHLPFTSIHHEMEMEQQVSNTIPVDFMVFLLKETDLDAG